MYDALRDLLESDEFSVLESFEISGRPARHAPIPRYLLGSRVGLYLHRKFRLPASKEAMLWTHQSQALDALGRGDDVVISTGTASGKSLIFQVLAFHKALRNPNRRLLVFYPLKALAADQLQSWRKMGHSLECPEDFIGRVDGSVPVRDREDVLERSRIVIMTPDVCHAWLMSRLSLPTVRNFVRALSVLVMDEAHTLGACAAEDLRNDAGR